MTCFFAAVLYVFVLSRILDAVVVIAAAASAAAWGDNPRRDSEGVTHLHDLFVCCLFSRAAIFESLGKSHAFSFAYISSCTPGYGGTVVGDTQSYVDSF